MSLSIWLKLENITFSRVSHYIEAQRKQLYLSSQTGVSLCPLEALCHEPFTLVSCVLRFQRMWAAAVGGLGCSNGSFVAQQTTLRK